MNIQFLLTGNEVMSGDVIDTNSVIIARMLRDMGFEVIRKTAVPDNLQMLTDELKDLSRRADILIVNGGLGPTDDDLTAEALAAAAGVGQTYHTEALAHLENWCRKRGIQLNPANRKQAFLPEGCAIIPNPVGTAVGFAITLNRCRIFCTPGVPRELEVMLKESIRPELLALLPEGGGTKTIRMKTFGYGESALQQKIKDLFPDWPRELEIGFRASMPVLEVKITARTPKAHDCLTEWEQKLRGLISAHIFGKEDETLAECTINALRSKGYKITAAESCTGGQISAALTQVPGASDVFEAGFVVYSNRMKTKILGVKPDTLNTYGAVSSQTVSEMLAGALRISGADFGSAVSGVAGPGGGTAEKPVGMVWTAWGTAGNILTKCFMIPFERRFFQIYTTHLMLDLVRRLVFQIDEKPNYFNYEKK